MYGWPSWDPTGSPGSPGSPGTQPGAGNERFAIILGTNWELGIGNGIASWELLGASREPPGNLIGKQNHWNLQLVAARCIYVLVVAANLELVIKCMDCCMESMSYYDSLRTTVRTMYSTYYTVPTGTRVRSYTYCKHKVLVPVLYHVLEACTIMVALHLVRTCQLYCTSTVRPLTCGTIP